MEREVHEPDEVNRGKVIFIFSLFLLLLDGEGGIEHGPFIEEPLWCHLQFNDKARPVRVGAFNVDADIPLPWKGVGVLRIGVGKIVVLR